MNYDNNFIRFLNKFDCAYNQVRARGLFPSFSEWNILVSPCKTFVIKDTRPGIRTNPFSILLEGQKINTSVFGKGDYSIYYTYCAIHYPYMQIERMFLFPGSALYAAFYQGFTNRGNYQNIYEDVRQVTFDVGRYLLNKYFGYHLPILKYHNWMK